MDWMRSGWGPEYSPEFDSLKNYHVDLSSLVITNKPLLEISSRVIADISRSYPKPYKLMVSGGVDSQSMLWCWANSNVDFEAVCVQLVDSTGRIYNQHDYSAIIDFAKHINVPITFVKFNVIEFLNTKLSEYAHKYQCTSPQVTTHMAMSELLEGTKIFSGNFIPGGLYDYTILGLNRYAKLSGYSVVPFFLMHDPELAGALIQYESDMDLRKPIPYERKVKLLKSAGIPVVPQITKLTGFEIIKDYYDIHHSVTAKDKIKYHNRNSKRNFDILFRYRLSDTIKYQDHIVFTFPNLPHRTN